MNYTNHMHIINSSKGNQRDDVNHFNGDECKEKELLYLGWEAGKDTSLSNHVNKLSNNSHKYSGW